MKMSNTAKIAEIFTSIQGEGTYVGVKQLFIRFCRCNLNCAFCDTDFHNGTEYSPKDLLNKLKEFDLKTIHSVSLTGGEPLFEVEFLKKFLPHVNKKIYLETNATMPEQLEEIADFVDIISADIKLPTVSGENVLDKHDKFFQVAKMHGKELFAKIVFDEKITDYEIDICTKLAQKYDIPLILQPKTLNQKIAVPKSKIEETFNKFLQKHDKTRLIPQVHVFLGVE